MFLTILVNLYTVRVIWNVLGVDDYGIYNVVGGIVLMFAFLNNAMVASSQRFISFELGTGDFQRLKKIFAISVTVHAMLALGILILAESIGLWFLNERLNIPPGRMYAANWVYQCSIIAFIINVISVPYNACIVAHEHMKQFGYFGILEVLLKLVIVFLLLIIPFDKLITYSVLVVCVAVTMRLIYGIYCRRHFDECRFAFVSDHNLMKDMFSFAGWSFIGNMGFAVRDQGLNIIVNLFFNVAVNAAKGVANQIGNVISGFAGSFQMALNPQITKQYAAGDSATMLKLVFRGCKFSVLLMMLITVPLYFATPEVMKLWLQEVAPYTDGFVKLILIMILIDSMGVPITTALQATGHIKWFQILISIIMALNLPLAWLWLTIDRNPYVVVFVAILTSAIGVATRLCLLHNEVIFSYRSFLLQVVMRVFPTLFISFVISGCLYIVIPHSLPGIVCFICCSVSVVAASSIIIGLDTSERQYVTAQLLNRLKIRRSH